MTRPLPSPVQGSALIDANGKPTSHFYRWIESINTSLTTYGPTFSAYQSSAQTALIANTWTKILLQTEDFDSANNFNVSTARFTPNRAGYYYISGNIKINGTSLGLQSAIYKNGSRFKEGSYVAVNSTNPSSHVTSVIYFNGSTDYVELWGLTVTALAPIASNLTTYFNGSFLRDK